MKISIIIPVYNEAKTIRELIQKVKDASFGFDAEREIVVIDDGSTDGTAEILKSISGIEAFGFSQNKGKGAALKEGFRRATGDVVLTQDADFEYDTSDYPALLAPLREGRADVVFGNRFEGEIQKVVYSRSYFGNKFLTWLSNKANGLKVGDMEVGYKVFQKNVLDSFAKKLKSKRFGIEPELTARIAKGGWKVAEVPINYYGRSYEEGKKIGWWDGLKAIFVILYFNFLNTD